MQMGDTMCQVARLNLLVWVMGSIEQLIPTDLAVWHRGNMLFDDLETWVLRFLIFFSAPTCAIVRTFVCVSPFSFGHHHKSCCSLTGTIAVTHVEKWYLHINILQCHTVIDLRTYPKIDRNISEQHSKLASATSTLHSHGWGPPRRSTRKKCSRRRACKEEEEEKEWAQWMGHIQCQMQGATKGEADAEKERRPAGTDPQKMQEHSTSTPSFARKSDSFKRSMETIRGSANCAHIPSCYDPNWWWRKHLGIQQ